MGYSAEAETGLSSTRHETESDEPCGVQDPDARTQEGGRVRFSLLAEASTAEKLDVCNILAGLLYGVEPDTFEPYSRQERRVNEARQLGIYLANVCLGVSYEDIALPARRNRSTVRYGIERVEDRRENPQFDMAVVVLETFIGCLQDRNVVDMIKSGLQVDFDRIAWIPITPGCSRNE